MIDRLTPQQELLMSSIIEEWRKVPFDTSPINKEQAESAINLTYQSREEDKPKEIVWFDNPSDAVIWMMDNLDYLEQLEEVPSAHYAGGFSTVSHTITWTDEITDFIDRNIPQNIQNKFREQWNQFLHCKYTHWLSESFLANFYDAHLRNHLRQIWGEEYWEKRVGDYNCLGHKEVIAMHDIYYLALSSFYHAIGYDRSEFSGFWEAAKYCGLWWAFADVAVVIPKPQEINLDSEYRLHSEGKPAIVYQGFKSYANHGRYISSQ